MDTKVNICSRPSAWMDYKNSIYKYNENDCIEVTEWSNGDGVDIDIQASIEPGKRKIQMTCEELEMINQIINKLTNQ